MTNDQRPFHDGHACGWARRG